MPPSRFRPTATSRCARSPRPRCPYVRFCRESPGAGSENVLVTVGAIEANFVVASNLTGSEDRMVTMLANYLQVWGAVLNRGADVAAFALATDRGRALDTDAIEAAVTPGTRRVAVCHPNNPTGRALTETEMDTVITAAERAGAWLLADEVDRGGPPTSRPQRSGAVRTERSQ